MLQGNDLRVFHLKLPLVPEIELQLAQGPVRGEGPLQDQVRVQPGGCCLHGGNGITEFFRKRFGRFPAGDPELFFLHVAFYIMAGNLVIIPVLSKDQALVLRLQGGDRFRLCIGAFADLHAFGCLCPADRPETEGFRLLPAGSGRKGRR